MSSDALRPTVDANTDAIGQLAATNAQVVAQLNAVSEALNHLSVSQTELFGLVEQLQGRVDNLAATFEPGGEVAEEHFDLGNYWLQASENYADLAAPFAEYERFIQALVALPTTRLLPLKSFDGPADPTSVSIGLRHDIDVDPPTAVRMARVLARHGLSGSFYFLHSAAYYSRVGSGHSKTIRNRQLREWVQAIIVAGSEIGLHNDALGSFLATAAPPATTVSDEIAFLRSLGAEVSGTVGHNSAPGYGAENCEVFAEHVLVSQPERVVTTPAVTAVLGSVDAASLDLTYEGTFARQRSTIDATQLEPYLRNSDASIRNESWMKTYLIHNPMLEWSVDAQLWHLGNDTWVLGGRDRDTEIWHWKCSSAEAIERIADLSAGTRLLAVLHPAYFRH